MTEILFNTMEVSKTLQVDKSTVKRWTDEGKLKCFRTPGGHRKFRAEDLYQFMSEYNYGISPVNLHPQFASDEAIIHGMIVKKEFHVLANVCFSASINGRRSEIVKLFSEVYQNGLSLPMIFDEILCPTLKRLLGLNLSGKLSAGEMQLAFNALSNAIILLSDIIMKPAPRDNKAILATVEGDKRDIELKALAILLESEGYEVLNLGANVPTETITQLATTKQPMFIFLYTSRVVQKETFIDQHTSILATAHSCGSKLIVGGDAYATPEMENISTVLYDRYFSSFNEFVGAQHEAIPAHPTMSSDKKNLKYQKDKE